MKILLLIPTLACCVSLSAAPDTLRLSPALLRSVFSNASDSSDHLLAVESSDIEFIAADGKSVYLAGGDTIISPQHGDELTIWYRDSAIAVRAFAQALKQLSDRSSSMYALAKTGLFTGRTGALIYLVWHCPDIDGYNARALRRFFRSAQFVESLEVFRTFTRLR